MTLDVLVVVDPRFSGGTAAALVTDVRAFSALGLSVGLLPVRSRFFTSGDDRPNPRILGLPDLPGVSRVDGAISARFAFFHHPLAFFHGVETQVAIRAERAVVVAHHPPFRGDGSLEYNPFATSRKVLETFGCRVWWAPVSGSIRAQLRSFTPFLVITHDDWVNTFDPEDWTPRVPVFDGGRAVVGRHGRADPLKWPDSASDASLSLSPGTDWETRVMGCPEEALKHRGVDTSSWAILPFNAVPVRDFLDQIDVFSYFYHPRWVEAFGRTIAEAILMERCCLLDRRLEPNFGDLADYCLPAEVPGRLARLRADPRSARMLAGQRRKTALHRFGVDSVGPRLAALAIDTGTRSRQGGTSASPVATLRKLAGLSRRRMGEARGGD